MSLNDKEEEEDEEVPVFEEQPASVPRQIVRGVTLIEELDEKGQPTFKAELIGNFQTIYELFGWVDIRWPNIGVIKSKLTEHLQRRVT